jgi:membrane protease YdiL (CAAX protease family)
MRLQFSIVTLLSLTAYAAMFSAAAADIFSRWPSILVWSVPICVVIAYFMAIFVRGPKQAFCCGFVVGAVAYFGFAVATLFLGLPSPHSEMINWLPEPSVPSNYPYADDYDMFSLEVFMRQELFAGSQCMLWSGVFFGLFARSAYQFIDARQLTVPARPSAAEPTTK